MPSWIPRDFDAAAVASRALPIEVLKGPRQVGKTSVLERLGTHQVVYFDDAAIRGRARENPRLFLDSLPSRLVLDEAALAPELFSELERRVDEAGVPTLPGLPTASPLGLIAPRLSNLVAVPNLGGLSTQAGRLAGLGLVAPRVSPVVALFRGVPQTRPQKVLYGLTILSPRAAVLVGMLGAVRNYGGQARSVAGSMIR